MGDGKTEDKYIRPYEISTKEGIAHPLYYINSELTAFNNISQEPPGYHPSQIRNAYNMGEYAGSGVVAIVSAFDYPTALADFNTFSRQFNLPIETSTLALMATNKVFQVVYARGVKPALDTGWAVESALDIEWAHAMAPYAKIVLVLAASNLFVDLFQAVDVANTIPNVKVISMSWGGFEWSNELLYDVHLKQPGVVYVAGSGDIGSFTLYPSVSQYVLSAGGTTLFLDEKGNRLSEEYTWINGGGGPSLFVPIPAYQANMIDVAVKCGSHRGTPDVALVANPATGVAIYDSTPHNGISGWSVIGGTSFTAPAWAGIINSYESIKGINFSSSTSLISYLYYLAGAISYKLPQKKYYDITLGNTGLFSATVAWDFCTGLGTPNFQQMLITDTVIPLTNPATIVNLDKYIVISSVEQNQKVAIEGLFELNLEAYFNEIKTTDVIELEILCYRDIKRSNLVYKNIIVLSGVNIQYAGNYYFSIPIFFTEMPLLSSVETNAKYYFSISGYCNRNVGLVYINNYTFDSNL